MAVSFVASAVPAGNPTTSFTVTIPSETLTGDVLVFAATNRDATADPSVTDNDAGGNAWAKLGGGATGLTVWWKRATGSTASKTLTASGFTGSSAGVVSLFRGVTAAATPYESVTTESNASADESHAGFTPSRNGSMVCLAIANRTNDISVTTVAATNPASLTAPEKLSTGGSDCSCALARGAQTTAGATGNITWAQTDAATVSCAFGLIPAWDALTVAVGAKTLGAVAVGLTAQRRLTVDSAARTLGAGSVGLTRGYTLPVASAARTLGAGSVGLRASRLLVAAAAALALGAPDVGIRAQRRITAASAARTLGAPDVTLTYEQNQGNSYELVVDAASRTLGAGAVSLRAQRRITVESAPRTIGAGDVGLTHGVGGAKTLASLTSDDQTVLLTLVPPVAGTNVGTGPHVAIPADWATRIANGEHVPGCAYLRVDGGTLSVNGQNFSTLVVALANQTLRDQCNAAALAAFETKWNAA